LDGDEKNFLEVHGAGEFGGGAGKPSLRSWFLGRLFAQGVEGYIIGQVKRGGVDLGREQNSPMGCVYLGGEPSSVGGEDRGWGVLRVTQSDIREDRNGRQNTGHTILPKRNQKP